MENKQNWLIGIGGSTADDVWTSRVRGTKEQIKQHLLNLVEAEKAICPEKWEHGTEKIEEIRETSPGHFYAYACFSDTHTDISAELEKEPVDLDAEKRNRLSEVVRKYLDQIYEESCTLTENFGDNILFEITDRFIKDGYEITKETVLEELLWCYMCKMQ